VQDAALTALPTMTDYTLRRTGLSDDPRSEDYQPHYQGIPIGRIYCSEFAGKKRFRWSIYINHVAQPAEGVALMGFTDTLDEGTAAFKASFEALMAAGTVKIPPAAPSTAHPDS
jgi:hypothetical protein